MTHSEIVLATTESLDKPFIFRKIIISGRGGLEWDGMMAHNPFIFKSSDGTYVLFYIGSPDGKPETRRIGYAYSKRLTDGWVRSDKLICLPDNSNNPAVVCDQNENILFYYRDGDLRVSIARANKYNEKFTTIKSNVFPESRNEDMFVYRTHNTTQIHL